MLRGDDEF